MIFETTNFTLLCCAKLLQNLNSQMLIFKCYFLTWRPSENLVWDPKISQFVLRFWSLRQRGMSPLICLKANNEEKLKMCLIFPLSKSKTNLPIFGAKKIVYTFLKLTFFYINFTDTVTF